MFRLEHKTGDEDAAKQDKPRLGKLVGRNETVWKDDYEANCLLRRNFRVRKKFISYFNNCHNNVGVDTL